MSDTVTPTLGLTKPQVGGSLNSFGPKINTDMDLIDAFAALCFLITGGAMTGGLGILAGTAGAPGIYIVGNSNTGIFASATGHLSLTVNGVLVADFDGNGLTTANLEITNALRAFAGAAIQGEIRPYAVDASNGGFDIFTQLAGALGFRMRISKEGRLGIGTNDPKAALDVYGNAVQSVIDMAAGSAVDCSQGNYFLKTITGNTTFTFVSVPTASTGNARIYGFAIELTNGGAFTVNWPTVKWPSGTAPTLTTSGLDILVFTTRDGGTTWRGMMSQRNST